MRRLRVQTEQWRKAAEAAATVLGGDNHLAGLHVLACPRHFTARFGSDSTDVRIMMRLNYACNA
jgi:hypothetical protein